MNVRLIKTFTLVNKLSGVPCQKAWSRSGSDFGPNYLQGYQQTTRVDKELRWGELYAYMKIIKIITMEK